MVFVPQPCHSCTSQGRCVKSQGVILNCPVLVLPAASEKQGNGGANHFGQQAFWHAAAASGYRLLSQDKIRLWPWKPICGRAEVVALKPPTSHVILWKLCTLKMPVFHSDKAKIFSYGAKCSCFLFQILSPSSFLHCAPRLEHFLLEHLHQKRSFLSCTERCGRESRADRQLFSGVTAANAFIS